ncbi:MAG: hypothetical protein VX951_05040 [Planctomycetota bacterium]|nr:hypothetical protein [Planctomycetota bacterium]
MQKLTVALLCAGLTSPLLTAQAGPGWTDPGAGPAYDHLAFDVALFPTNMTATGISQIAHCDNGLPGLTAGQFAVTMTNAGLSSTYGNVGGTGMCMGLYDRTLATPLFTPNTMANKMNPASGIGVFGLMIENRDGLYATCDWASGVVMSWRKDNSSDFHVPIAVTTQAGTPVLGTYRDPALGYIKGVLNLWYVNAYGRIVARPILIAHGGPNGELTLAELQGPERDKVITTAATTHSPTPMCDSNGEVLGLFYHKTVSGDSDAHLKSGTHLADFQGDVNDEAGWQNNGAVFGGTFVSANSAATPGYSKARARNMAWLLASRPAIGTTMTLQMGCANSGLPTVPPTVTIYAALGTLPALSLGGIQGFLGINPAPILLRVASVPVPAASGRAELKIPVPNDPTIKGVSLPIQGLATIVTASGVLGVFTNTTFIRIRK